jgi:elongation factor Ts
METGGDEAAAMELLRKRGAAAAEKKAGRATAEGRIGSYSDPEQGKAAMVELLCETAPVANNPETKELVDKIAKHAALTGQADPKAILEDKYVDDPNTTIGEMINDLINKIRENMKISRIVVLEGKSASYVHHNGKVGVVLTAEGQGEGEAEVLNDLCMHVAALQPEALNREQMPAEAVEKEKEIAKEQIIASGKPEHLVDKILTGKLNRWYGERVLLEQPFVKDDKKTVQQLLDEAGLKITTYERMQVGEVAPEE